jgi:hypothetical protein
VDYLHVFNLLTIKKDFHIVNVGLEHANEIPWGKVVQLINGLAEINKCQNEHVIATTLDETEHLL